MNLKLFINAIANKFLAVLYLFCFITALSFSPAYSATSPEVSQIATSFLITITEFYANPPNEENEWVEVYNPNDNELDISGWYLDDIEGGKAGSPYLITDVKIAPRSYLALDFPKSGVLNNTGGDEVRILDSQKQVVASVSYKNVKTSYSISLINGIWEFSSITKGGVNPVLVSDLSDEEEEINYPDDVKITEFMACPNKDEEEWIEIYNDTGEELDLTNWKIDDIKDGGSSPFVLDEEKVGKSLEVKKDSYFVISLSSSRFNNTGGDFVRLLNPNGDLVDETSYEECKTGYSYALYDGEFKLTKTPTPEEENEIVEDEIVTEEEEELQEVDTVSLNEFSGQVLSAQTSNPDIKIPETFEVREGVSEFNTVVKDIESEVELEVVGDKTVPKNLKVFLIFSSIFAGIMIYVFRLKIYGLWKSFTQPKD
ncbi:MAG: lamin tail domain-containing protein [bacterium]